MRIHPFQAIYPKLKLVTSPTSFFGTMKYKYPQYQRSGFFDKASKDAVYVYRIKRKKSQHLGFIMSTDIRDIEENKVLKHENTLASKEQSMMQLILEREAMIKPILLAYDRVKPIDDFINKTIKGKASYSVKFEETGEVHSFWQISDGDELEKITGLFNKKIAKSYIADGHHRCSTMCKLYRSDHLHREVEGHQGILSAYFSFSQLDIYDYNRILRIENTISPVKFVIALSELARITEIKSGKKPSKKHELTMMLEGNWYTVEWRNSVIKKIKSEGPLLDATIFNQNVLKRIMKVADIRSDDRIKYFEGIKPLSEMEKYVNSNPGSVGFLLYPIDKNELCQVAENNQSLPPKSTWFEPRIKNGLIVQDF